MEQIKPPKNFVLSCESMNAALDALRAGLSVKEATQEVAKTISIRTMNKTPALPSGRASKPSSRGARSSRPSSRGGSSSIPQSSPTSRSRLASVEEVKKAPSDTARSAEGVELKRTDLSLPSKKISEGGVEVFPTTNKAPASDREVISVEDDGQGATDEDALVIRDILVKTTGSRSTEEIPLQKESLATPAGVTEEVGKKRPLSSDAPAPVPKKSRGSKRAAPALPPLEKEKTAVVPLFLLQIMIS